MLSVRWWVFFPLANCDALRLRSPRVCNGSLTEMLTSVKAVIYSSIGGGTNNELQTKGVADHPPFNIGALLSIREQSIDLLLREATLWGRESTRTLVSLYV